MERITITGNVGKDSETVKINDKEYIKFSVGVYAGKDANGEVRTRWYTVLTNPAFSSIRKGERVLVEGLPSITAYLSKDSDKPTASVSIFANHVEVFRTNQLKSDVPF